MPECGSQVILCDLPVRFDTYEGCTHNCAYCFAKKKRNIDDIDTHESYLTLERFISGFRSREVKWVDWDIPLHWGGMSDPFQPAEARYKASLKCLQVFAATGYPFVFSTKGALAGTEPYLSLFKACNVVSQVSMVDPFYDRLEPGAPTFAERMEMLPRLAENTKRLIIRIQPYMVGFADTVGTHFQGYKDAGVFGVVVEGMKAIKKFRGAERMGGDWVYPVEPLRRDFERLRNKAHSVGLAFYVGENRLRAMGDDRCCCGVVGVPGFVPNKSNMNYLNTGGGN